MDTPIVADPRPARKTVAALAYFRINPITLYLNTDTVFIADGVITVDGAAWLGTVRGTGPAFVVAPLIDGDGYGWLAPDDWQSAITGVSRDNATLTITPPPSLWPGDMEYYAA